MSRYSTTRVSYVSGISQRPFVADLGEELPPINPVSYTDAQFAKYVARKAVFRQVTNLFKSKTEIDRFVYILTLKDPNLNTEELKSALNIAFKRNYNSEDAHNYALAPLTPGKYSSKGTIALIGWTIFKLLTSNSDTYRDKYDATYVVIQQAIEQLQSNSNGNGALYFLYLFLPDGAAEQLPAVAKKRKAQEKTLVLLADGLGVLKEDMQTFVRRVTRRNYLKEPEAIVNEYAGKRILAVPGEPITAGANTGPVRGNVTQVGRIGIVTAVIVGILALVAAIITATAQIVSSAQARKLAEAQASISQLNMPDPADFPATTNPINTTGQGGGGTESQILQTLSAKPGYLIAAGAAAYFLIK